MRQKLSEKINSDESTVILQAKSKIEGDRTPYVRKIKCEDNFPEVGKTKKKEQTVISRTVSDMTVLFENNLKKKEDNTLKIPRKNKGRQQVQGDQENRNFDNIVAAQNLIPEKSRNLNFESKRSKCDLNKQLLGQERGNLCKTNC